MSNLRHLTLSELDAVIARSDKYVGKLQSKINNARERKRWAERYRGRRRVAIQQRVSRILNMTHHTNQSLGADMGDKLGDVTEKENGAWVVVRVWCPIKPGDIEVSTSPDDGDEPATIDVDMDDANE